MNVSTMVGEDVFVVIDDLETGEILFEGTLWNLYRFNEQFNIWGFKMSLEWMLGNNKPVAFVTIDFEDKLEEFKDYITAVEEADDDIDDEEFEKLESFASWLIWK